MEHVEPYFTSLLVNIQVNLVKNTDGTLHNISTEFEFCLCLVFSPAWQRVRKRKTGTEVKL